MSKDITYELNDKKCTTKCKIIKNVFVGSTYCLHNKCGYNKGFNTAQKIVTCGGDDA